MDSSNGHPLLAQIPLIKSPLFNPPKAITLPSSYKPIPSIAPQPHVTKDNLEAWIREIESVKTDIVNYKQDEIKEYKNWEETVVKRLAPGYIGGTNTLLVPQRKVQPESEKEREKKANENDIDRAFETLELR